MTISGGRASPSPSTTRLGQGLGTEAMRLALAFGVEVLGLHRIDLRAMAHNGRAIALRLPRPHGA